MKTAVKVSYDRYIVLPDGALNMNVVAALEKSYIVTSGYGNDPFKRVESEQLEIGFYPDEKFPLEEEDYKNQLVAAKKEVSAAHTKLYGANQEKKKLKEELAELQRRVDDLSTAVCTLNQDTVALARQRS